MQMTRRGAMGVAAAIAVGGCAHSGQVTPPRMLVIAHRGASGLRPEHTLAAYRLGIELGADYIEPDLVPTKDGVLVCRHENEIGGTTDVAARPEFAARKVTKIVDGESVTGWFTEDFTLAELKTLRAKERLPQLRPQNTAFDAQETIPTFDEMLELVAAESKRLGRQIGVYPETKHPTYFAALGLIHDGPMLEALARHGFGGNGLPVFVQSFEVANLKRLAGKTRLPLVQLIAAEAGPADAPGTTYASMLTPEGLKDVARYAAGIGLEKALLLAPSGSQLVKRAHALGLTVHAWTVRKENYFLADDLRRGDATRPDFLRLPGDMAGEIARLKAAGVEGFFSDDPGLARAAVGP